jgi:hypothetical protein
MIPSFSPSCSFSPTDIHFLLQISSLGCQIHVHGVFQAVGYWSLVQLLHKRHSFVIFRYRRELGKRNQETEYIETYPTELMRRKLRYPVAKAEDVSIAIISTPGRSVCGEKIKSCICICIARCLLEFGQRMGCLCDVRRLFLL